MKLTDLFGSFIPAAQAHEKWFVELADNPPPLPAEFLPGSQMFTMAVLAVAILTIIGLLFDRRVERSSFYAKTEAKLRVWRDFAPGILAVGTAVALFWAAWQGTVLADDYAAPAGSLGMFFRVVQFALGAAFLTGFGTASAALGLGALYLSTFWLTGSVAPLDYLYFAGITVYLYAFARGRYSLDWFYGKPVLSTPDGRKRAYFALRVLTGAGFLALAFVKWVHPELHFELMDAYPDWNPYVILGMLGMHMTREVYVLCLAVVETIAGIYVLGGLFTRFVAVGLMPVFTASIMFLGPLELIGHLPILGILFVLFVYGDTYHKALPSPSKN